MSSNITRVSDLQEAQKADQAVNEIVAALAPLARELKTTSQFLFQKLTEYQAAHAIAGIVFDTFLVAALSVLLFRAHRFGVSLVRDDRSDGQLIGFLVLAGSWFILGSGIVFGFASIQTEIATIVAPEASALFKILALF